MNVWLNMLWSALSQGMLYAPMALGVYVTFRILKTPDLTVDGSFVFGMTVCAAVTIAGHPVLALFAGALAGALAGLCTALLQTKAHVEPILSGILVSTGLYTINFSVLGGKRGVVVGLISAMGGSLAYRIVLQLAYKMDMPSYAVKLMSTITVIIALTLPLLRKKLAKRIRKGGASA